jgi:hypothetical protein
VRCCETIVLGGRALWLAQETTKPSATHSGSVSSVESLAALLTAKKLRAKTRNSRGCFDVVARVDEACPLDLSCYHVGIDRHTLRNVRNGKPARREVLAALTELSNGAVWRALGMPCDALAAITRVGDNCETLCSGIRKLRQSDNE